MAFSFRLVQLEGLALVAWGLMYLVFPHMPAQAFFFLGSSVPYPLPWQPAPFKQFITQKGLQEAFPMILTVLRALGGAVILSGIVVFIQGCQLQRRERAYHEEQARRGRRGVAVHSKIMQYENQIGAEQQQQAAQQNTQKGRKTMPMFLITIVHAAAAAGLYYVHTTRPFKFQTAEWAVLTGMALHAACALVHLLAQISQSQLARKEAEAKKTEAKAQ